MLPSTFVQRGLNSDNVKDGDQSTNSETASRAAAAASLLGAAQRPQQGSLAASSSGATSSDLALLESMIAQEQQRRRAFLLAASSPFTHGGTGNVPLSSASANSAAAALMAAERQRAIMFSGGLFGGLSGLERDILSMNRLGLASLGGFGSSLNSFPPGIGGGSFVSNGSGLVRNAGAPGTGDLSGNRDTLGMMSNQAVLLAAHQHHQLQQQHNAITNQPSIANDQLLLDAMEQGGRKGRTGTFPQKLHQMLSDLEKEEGGSEIASYLPHGRAFAIHKPNEFVKKIMPKYFRMSRFSSFQRQLNLYEFMRITDGPDKGAYFHELFHRGRPVLASQIRRNKIKGDSNTTGVKRDKLLGSDTAAAFGVPTLLPGAARLTGVSEAMTRVRGGNDERLASHLIQDKVASVKQRTDSSASSDEEEE